MWIRKNTIGNRLAGLFGFFFILIICVGVIQYFYTVNIHPDKAALNYQKTDCFLISKRLSHTKTFFPKYRADFLISYNGKGIQYNRWVSSNGLDASFTSDLQAQKNILSQFQVGNTYPCWYNPADPQSVVLIKRHHWATVATLIFPATISVIAFYFVLTYFIQSLNFLINAQQLRREENENTN